MNKGNPEAVRVGGLFLFHLSGKERVPIFRDYPDVVSVEQLCKMLHIGKNTAYSLLKSGTIPAIRIGRQYRIPKNRVIQYVNSQN